MSEMKFDGQVALVTGASRGIGVDFGVKKVVNDMAVLESQDERKQILTELNTLKLRSFYLKKEKKDQ